MQADRAFFFTILFVQLNSFRLLPGAGAGVLGCVTTEPDGKSLPEFVSTGFDEFDAKAIVVGSFSIRHLQQMLPNFKPLMFDHFSVTNFAKEKQVFYEPK